MFYVISGQDRCENQHVRSNNKVKHTAHLDRGAPEVKVLQSGPILSPEKQQIGSLIIVQATSLEVVKAFVAKDPYVQAGLFSKVEIHEWLWVRGNSFLP